MKAIIKNETNKRCNAYFNLSVKDKKFDYLKNDTEINDMKLKEVILKHIKN